jgi:predicted permease
VLDNILDILIPIYGIVIAAFIMGKFNFPWASKKLTPLVLHVALPCLVIRQLSNDRANPEDMLWMLLAAAMVFGFASIIAYIFLKLTKQEVKTYLAAFTLNNMSIGIAVGILGFGDNGLALCLGFASIILVAQFTFGMWSYEGRIVWQVLFKEPFIWAFLLALAFMFFKVQLPTFIDKTLEQLGHLTIPLLLLALGFALAEIKITGFARAMIFSGVRLGIFFGVSWLVVLILGFEGETRAIVLLMSVLPASTINILMANQTGKIDMPPLTVTIMCTNIWMAAALPVAMILWLPSK